jgi:hypothetical protein
MSEELNNLLKQVHEGITIFDFDGKPVPCIIFEEKKYDEILSKVAGKALSINTDLNILQDGLGHVFVEIVLTFSEGGIEEKILINANKDILFFVLSLLQKPQCWLFHLQNLLMERIMCL